MYSVELFPIQPILFEDHMYNIKSSFFSILLLIVFCTHVLNGMEDDGIRLVISRSPSRTGATEDSAPEQRSELEELLIERSPSASKDMPDYIMYVEKKVATQELKTPGQNIYLDFGNTLLNLLKRLEQDPVAQKKQEWQTAFTILGTTLARYHRVTGLKFVHPTTTDYSVEKYLIEPFAIEQKLEKIKLSPEREWLV
jgi:succinate dehydrogenase hydrophobic anchor subunit